MHDKRWVAEALFVWLGLSIGFVIGAGPIGKAIFPEDKSGLLDDWVVKVNGETVCTDLLVVHRQKAILCFE